MLSDQLPDHARVWIYQSSRFLAEEECQAILEETRRFLETWTAHDKDLLAGVEIRYGLFLLIQVDEQRAQASGCSIDKSVHFVRDLGTKHHVDFMNRMLFAYRNDGAIQLVDRPGFERLVADGVIHDGTTVFNNLVSTRKELEHWEIPFQTSWHKQFV